MLHAHDPEGFFCFLTPKQMKTIMYCEDADFCNVDSATLNYADVQSLLKPGDFVMIWAETWQCVLLIMIFNYKMLTLKLAQNQLLE